MDTKFCINCGKKISKSNQFCPYCGAEQNLNSDNNTDPVNYNGSTEGSTTNNYRDYSQVSYQTNHNGLTPAEQNYVRTYVHNHSRHMLPAYLLMLVFVCATHFYLHQNAAGVVLLVINLICDWFLIGFIIDLVWGMIDLFLIPLWVHNNNARAKKQAISVVMMNRQNASGGVNVNVN